MNNWKTAAAQGRPERIDRTANRINGYVVAQSGEFKSGRGAFDHKSLKLAWRLMRDKKGGTKVRMGHTDMGSVGSFLGRAINPRIEDAGDGTEKLRADLQFNSVAFRSPAGDLATYVMDLAESDPEALSSSLVLMADEEWQLDSNGRKKRDKEGRELSPLWRPTHIEFSDIVTLGDAAGALLSAVINEKRLTPEEQIEQWERDERALQVRAWEIECIENSC